jgi:hypothetical protein
VCKKSNTRSLQASLGSIVDKEFLRKNEDFVQKICEEICKEPPLRGLTLKVRLEL